jgi:hypothetical protein
MTLIPGIHFPTNREEPEKAAPSAPPHPQRSTHKPRQYQLTGTAIPTTRNTSTNSRYLPTVFGDDNMAAAVIDRIVHHGRLLQFRGESYRVKNALMK